MSAAFSAIMYMNTSLQPAGKNLMSNGLSLVSIHYFTPKVIMSMLYTVCCIPFNFSPENLVLSLNYNVSHVIILSRWFFPSATM